MAGRPRCLSPPALLALGSLVVACSRFGFAPPPGTLGDTGLDRSGDVATADALADGSAEGGGASFFDTTGVGPPEVVCDWSVAPPAFDGAVLLAELNSDGFDSDPLLSWDASALFYSSVGENYVSTRVDRAALFSDPRPVDSLVTPGEAVAVAFSGDGLIAVASGSGWPGGRGNSSDLFIATRASVAAPFASWTPLAGLNSDEDEFDPRLSYDGLELYFATRGHGGVGALDIARTARGSRSEPFSAVQLVAELNTSAQESSPSLTSDGRTIVFVSGRDGNISNIYYAIRPVRGSPFNAPQRLEALSTNISDVEPVVSLDGCDIVFGRIEPPGGEGGWELLQALPAD